jgi:hypothetical protein
MSGFTKLVPEIVQSSLWNEAAEIRCVWIAMIATKDDAGYVRGDARTIARVANVSLESATAALDRFQKPDPSSHTPDNEGRRIMPAPGGWIILNHAIYRARDDVYREKNRARVRRFRSKMEGNSEDVTLHETLGKRDPSASVSASESVFSEGDARGGSIPDGAKHASEYLATVKACPKLTADYELWLSVFHSIGLPVEASTVNAVIAGLKLRPESDWRKYGNRLLGFAVADVAKKYTETV